MRLYDVGIDIGTHKVAWALFDEEVGHDAGSVDYSAAKYRRQFTREQELFALSSVVTAVADPPAVRLWIERPYLSGGPGANATTTIGMAETVGALRSAAPWHAVELVVPNTWKAAVLGMATASKEQIQQWLHEHTPEAAACCSIEDEYDAMGLSIYGSGRGRGEILPPEPKKPRKRAARKA